MGLLSGGPGCFGAMGEIRVSVFKRSSCWTGCVILVAMVSVLKVIVCLLHPIRPGGSVSQGDAKLDFYVTV